MSFTCGERCLADVEKLLQLSKLPCDDLQTRKSQCIFFGEQTQREDIVLFEMDKHALHDISNSHSVCIKGREDEGAVLVTDALTYDIKECETSNTTLMLSGRLCEGKEDGEMEGGLKIRKVEGVQRGHYELKATLPRVAVLRQLLAEEAYAGGEHEAGHTFEELLRVVQCSAKQLEDALNKEQAICVHGRWRQADFDFLCQCFRHLIASTQECHHDDDDDDDLSIEKLRTSMMKDFNEDVTSHMMKRFVVQLEGDSCRLNEQEVCKMYALMLLVPSPKFLQEDFDEAWKLCVPRGMKPDYSFIKGVAVLEGEGRGAVLRYLPSSQLPFELDARLQRLFAFKERWTLEDIEPYLRDVCIGSSTVTDLLLKHTRMSSLNGAKVFGSKRF